MLNKRLYRCLRGHDVMTRVAAGIARKKNKKQQSQEGVGEVCREISCRSTSHVCAQIEEKTSFEDVSQ